MIVLHAVFEERDWPVEYVPRLRVLGSLMATALARQRAFDAVREGEARLREHAARLAAAFDAAELGFAEWRALDAPPFLDARMRDLFGLGPDEEDRLPDSWLSRIDETSRASVLELRRRVLAGEIERATAEYRYEHPARGPIWLRHTWRRVVGDVATDDAVTLVGAALDITESREREEALQAAHEDVKRLRDRLERENIYLRRQVLPANDSELVTGRSPAIAHALNLAGQVAATTSTVLLIGETGTGKERFAAHIHEASPRRARAMVRVNCSAIPAALIESELFGREKGAYTGALSKQIGRFELANGSTLFLDEIGDLPLDVQVKLLRVLQERTIERLGNPASIAIDVRIIAASNRDLDAAVRAGTFRSDLYYRLNVFPITVPPLRERREDIPALAHALVQELSDVMRKRFVEIDGASLEALTTCDWPGNVRELRNLLERAMILSPGPILTVAPPHGAAAAPRERDARAGSRDLRELEREHILRVLEETGWRIRGQDAAAAKLGLKPTTLEARMARLGIRRPGARAQA